MIISVIIPVYNSSKLITELVNRLEDVFKKNSYELDLVLIDDCSLDDSWNNIKQIASKNVNYKCIKFLKNYGQHNAILCGLRISKGDFCITLDDDLQNPPEEIPKLVKHAIINDNDLIFGRYIKKRTTLVRSLGSTFVSYCVNKIFLPKKYIFNSNFRLIRRDIIDRIVLNKKKFPYINGLALENSKNPDNVLVHHNKRNDGKSTYTFSKIFFLLTTIFFNYSSWPIRIVTLIGLIFAICGFVLGLYFLITRLLYNDVYSGWTSLFVMLCFFSGINLLILGIIGEYIIKLNNEVKDSQQYIIDEKINM